jgi:Concanavalin A-like lectin/glucanases superfamily
MRHRNLALATLFVALLAVVLMASPAWAALVKVADWQMGETPEQMIDSSANGNNGTPTDVAQTDNSTYVFNGSTSRVAVPDHDSLDPQANDITVTASVKVNGEAMDDDSYDIVRKGLSTTSGGDYKMEIQRTSDPTVGKLHCLFKGSGGRVNKVTRVDIVDGSWHTLECIKTSTSVVARVDGRSYTKAGSAGSISNPKEVLVGAKTANPLDDVFDGSMDFVSIDIAQ